MLGTLSKVFGDRGACAPRVESDHESPKDQAGKQPLDPASPEWLAYYAQVAPPEISKWVNPADGSGSISYERLVDNLNSLSIPAIPMKPFASTAPDPTPDISRGVSSASSTYLRQATLKQPRGGSAVRSSSESNSHISRSRLVPSATHGCAGTADGSSRQRSTSLVAASNAASRVPLQTPGHDQRGVPPEVPLTVPVTAITRQYIGPVPEVRGPISGVSCGELSRPGAHSQVPPDYVEIINSRQMEMYGVSRQETVAQSQHTVVQGTPAGVYAPVVTTHADTITTQPVQGSRQASRTNFHKPPPIFLTPVTGRTATDGSSKPPPQIPEDLDPPPRKGVMYKLGQYVWSEEEIVLGTRDKPDPPLDPIVRQLCSGAIFPEVRTEPPPREESPKQETTEKIPAENPGELEEVPRFAKKLEDLGVPAIVEYCKNKRAELEKLADSCATDAPDDLTTSEKFCNRGGRGGLVCARHVSKGSVVFVELPMLTAEVDAFGLWPAFQALTEEQKAQLEKLEGCAAELSDTEALACVLQCKNAGVLGSAGAFQDFLGKMKLHAHGLSRGRGWALYPRAARIKHSCRPNTTYRNLDGLLVVFALEDIEEGAPITMSYIDQLYLPTEERRKRVLAATRVFCQCDRCCEVTQKERKVLCPRCRPVKLRLVENEKSSTAKHSMMTTLPALAEGDEESAMSERSVSRASQEAGQEAKQRGFQPGQTPVHPEPCPSSQFATSPDLSCQSSDYDGGEEKFSDCCSSDCLASSDGEEDGSKHQGGQNTSEVDREVGAEAQEGGEYAAAGVADELATSSEAQSDCGTLQLSSNTTASAPSSDSDVAITKAHCKTSKTVPGESPLASLASSDTIATGIPGSSTDRSVAGLDSDRSVFCPSSDSEVEESGEKATVGTPATETSGAPAILAEHNTTTDTIDKELESRLEAANMPRNYCVYEGPNCWRCYTCQETFTDAEMPVAMEKYLVGNYAALRNKFANPCPERWNNECGKLIRSVEKVLGSEHWLYAAGQLLLARLYLGMWMGGLVVEDIFEKAVAHAGVFYDFLQRYCPMALSTDGAPLIVALLRNLLFNGRWKVYVEWVERREVLRAILDTQGRWDEVYVAFVNAYLHIRKQVQRGAEPGLALLHRYAHASQYTLALDVEYHEKLENARVAKLREAEEQQRKKAEEALRSKEARRRLVEQAKQNIAAMKAAPPLTVPKVAKDVTLTHPDSIVGQYLQKSAIPGAEMAVRAARLVREDEGDNDDRSLTSAELAAQTAYEQAKRLQQLGVEGRYPASLAAKASLPGSANGTYLPLLMLADPLQARAEQRRQLKKTMLLLHREEKRREKILEAMKGADDWIDEALDFEDDESDAGDPVPRNEEEEEFLKEEGFIYRVPGLHGTAPGEYVTISQLNHTKDGSFPPLPFFKTFFYIDHNARRLTQPDADKTTVTMLGCGSGGAPPLSYDELQDIETAKEMYLEKESQEFREEVQARVNFQLAQKTAQAAAALRATKQGSKKLFCGGSGEKAEGVGSQVTGKTGHEQRSAAELLLEETNKAVKEMAVHEAEVQRRINKFQEDAREQLEKARKGPLLTDDPAKAGQRTIDGLAIQMATTEEREHMLKAAETESGPLPVAGRRELRYRVEGDEIKQLAGDAGPSLSPSLDDKTIWAVRPVEGPSDSRPVVLDQTEHAVEVNRRTSEEVGENLHDAKSRSPSPDGSTATRFLKPLDYSHIPPPPQVMSLALCGSRSMGQPAIGLHSQYKLARAHGLPLVCGAPSSTGPNFLPTLAMAGASSVPSRGVHGGSPSC